MGIGETKFTKKVSEESKNSRKMLTHKRSKGDVKVTHKDEMHEMTDESGKKSRTMAVIKVKGTVSRKSWRDKAMVSKSRLQLRIATGFKIFLIGPLIPVMFQSFHFA
jgi:hypothetical protein